MAMLVERIIGSFEKLGLIGSLGKINLGEKSLLNYEIVLKPSGFKALEKDVFQNKKQLVETVKQYPLGIGQQAKTGKAIKTKPTDFSNVNFNSLELTSLGSGTSNLGEKIPPKKFNSQAERLKDYYESKGVPFLLPHQEYSDKRIADTIELLGKDIDNLIKNKQLNKETIQKTLEKLAPEAKGKIEIKDFVDFENDMRASAISEDRIKLHLKANANTATNFDKKNVAIYMDFEKAKESGYAPLFFKKDIMHEATHGLTNTLQNTFFTNFYKNNIYKATNQQAVFNEIFTQLKNSYHPSSINLRQIELNHDKMLWHYVCNSTDDLNKSFETNLNKLIEDAKSTGELNIGNSKKSWKQFFYNLKEFAKGEKNAYQSNKVFREVYGDLNTPTNLEFDSMMYAEMEKFLNKKRMEI